MTQLTANPTKDVEQICSDLVTKNININVNMMVSHNISIRVYILCRQISRNRIHIMKQIKYNDIQSFNILKELSR